MVAGTMLSLFDGSGGFSLAGRMVGIEPVMASEVKPYPVAVTRSRFPKMKHLGSVTEIKGDEIEPVDVVTFGSPCFPEGTLVLTKTGYEPIENIRVGDEVFTHKGNWKPVSAVGYKHSRTVRMKGNHYGLIATPNHPFYSAVQGKVWNGNGYTKTLECVGEWRPAEEMQGRRWAIPNHILGVEIPKIECTSAKGNRPPKINEDLMYVLGRYLGDGWLRDGQRPNRPAGQTWGQIFICANHKKADFLEEQMRKVFDGNSAMYRIKERTVEKIRVSNTALCKWIKKNFGQKATGKTIPSWVFCMSESMRTALLQGYLDSDGYHVKENSWKITTVSKKLAHSVRLLGETLGYSTTVYAVDVEKTKMIEGRLVQQNTQYVASLSNEKRKTGIKDGIHTWYKCRSVEPYSEEQKVYNITVDDDHSYVVEGFVVHNCQNLSMAGNRKGLEGDQSKLLYEAIRIIKEMRKATNGLYPTFAVWENVFGAFSSNRGEDFRAVLQEFIQIAEPTAIMPPVPKGGWSYADCYRGDGWSLAYRTVDAQYWGVPQRRRRIYLVLDLGGECASEILFNSKSLLWHTSQSREAWQSVAGDTADSVGTADRAVGVVPYTLKIRSGCDGGQRSIDTDE